ncbi:DNA-directed RNA polymerases I and III subunit RPAC1 [Neocloeon triangulifer]|uniref:DNA-directed RNA polymerases I and III subunit RPAC1 n=1 Tax=Neocloeon triangulifer TaxID=2078957 RepID=UPI00286FA4AD|nr:DNA-directed RNA polymerases I and III subunit RPAC1 [Neocloeon triangulifer]
MDNNYILTDSGPLKAPSKPSVWSLKFFKTKFKIQVMYMGDMEMEFDMVGVEPSLANAFRRILLSEVPSIAIKEVHMYMNTSVIQDEVLAHRIGLIPFKANPHQFETQQEGAAPSEQDTLEFELKIKCTKNNNATAKSTELADLYKNHAVYSKSIKWLPMGDQEKMFSAADVGPVFDDILIAKLRPGQEIEMKMLAGKGCGKDHAKYSPVSTASYRLLPTIELTREIEGDAAHRLQKSFSPGVIEVVEKKGKSIAKVKNARYDNGSRNYMLHPDLASFVKVGRVPDHHIFTIESVGAMEPEALFLDAVKVLKTKCTNLLAELDKCS